MDWDVANFQFHIEHYPLSPPMAPTSVGQVFHSMRLIRWNLSNPVSRSQARCVSMYTNTLMVIRHIFHSSMNISLNQGRRFKTTLVLVPYHCWIDISWTRVDDEWLQMSRLPYHRLWKQGLTEQVKQWLLGLYHTKAIGNTRAPTWHFFSLDISQKTTTNGGMEIIDRN